MTETHLRRKGRGKTQRPTCPTCQQDLTRAYTRTWDKEKRAYIPFGWVCIKCHTEQWD